MRFCNQGRVLNITECCILHIKCNKIWTVHIANAHYVLWLVVVEMYWMVMLQLYLVDINHKWNVIIDIDSVEFVPDYSLLFLTINRYFIYILNPRIVARNTVIWSEISARNFDIHGLFCKCRCLIIVCPDCLACSFLLDCVLTFGVLLVL